MDLETIRRVAQRIGRDIEAELIVLFGSTRRIEERPPEDLDLAVLARVPLDTLALTNRFIQALRFQAVDLVDLQRADPVLLAQVARDGLPLYQARSGVFAEFASLAARKFADTRKFRDAEREQIRTYVNRVPGGS